MVAPGASALWFSLLSPSRNLRLRVLRDSSGIGLLNIRLSIHHLVCIALVAGNHLKNLPLQHRMQWHYDEILA
jgi:hypothetical protein